MSGSVGARSGLRRRKTLGMKAETFPLIESFLPDDVVMDILSRLSAKDVLRCRCVCKRWRDVTSTRDFIDLHLRCSIPMILKDDRDGQVLLDRCWEPAQTRSKIHKLYGPDDRGVVFSHNGLIVVAASRRWGDSESVFIIYNPIYCDVVNIKVSTREYNGRVCGVFFHPVQKEYCTLWQKILSFRPCKVQYTILNLESNLVWRDICTQNTRILYFEPVLIDKYLYWIVKPSLRFNEYSFNCEIMEYDIINEKFRVIRCPVRVKVNEIYVNLVDNDGVLSLINTFPSKELAEISIWILNDGGEQLWTSCNYVVSNDLYSGNRVPKAIAIRNGELVLKSNGRLYVCNLEFGTFRTFGRSYKSNVKFLPHVTSLVSVKNWKSNICMANEDENKQP